MVDCDKVLRNGRRIEPAFAADSLHLSAAGYEALAAALRPVLERVVAGLRKRWTRPHGSPAAEALTTRPMLFNTPVFAVFFVAVLALYWPLRRFVRAQNVLIVVASYVFYGWWDVRFLYLAILSSVLDFYCALMIDEGRISGPVAGVGDGSPAAGVVLPGDGPLGAARS